VLRRLGYFSFFVLAAAAATAQDLPELKKRGSLRVIVDSSNLVERFNTEAGEPGLEKELLLGFAALHQMKLEVVTVDNIEARLQALNARKGDVVAGTVVTESRKKIVAFTSEVLPSRHVVVTRKPAAPIESLEALRATRVGVTKGSSWAEAARTAGVPAANVDDSYMQPEDQLAALKERKVGAAVMTVVWAILERKRDPELQLGLFIGEPSIVGFGVRKESPLLLKALDEYVANLRKTATWSRLVVKYFGANALEILKKSRSDLP
jgi:membrane-bound lytic murein transglycosylase F